jgi:antibiotic biosynthesis monooxygenase (ABM) superfamily enzyme
VVSNSLFHVFLCRHINFSNFYAIFSALSHTCLVLLSLGFVDRLCYTAFLCALYTIYFSLLVLLVVNIALILVTHVAIPLVDCTFSAWISPLQSQAYKVMNKQTGVAQQCF